MSIASSANAAQLILWRWVGLALLAVITVDSVGGQPFRPAPKQEGKGISEPPAQGRPWAAPETKLPKFLLDATAALFEQGAADPRECVYRNVEIGDGGGVVKARGFVSPERADVPGRFVVCWDGVVHPALTVGELADLDGDVKDLAARMRQMREAALPNQGHYVTWAFPSGGRSPYGIAGVQNQSPIKLCLLLRVGRVDLAEALFAAGTDWTPDARPLTNYGISYLSLANDWAGSAFVRLIEAHKRGDAVNSLDSARRLVKFRELASAKAEAMGFAPGSRRDGGSGPAPRFDFLDQLDDLLRDNERRAKESPREPIPPKGGDPTARVAALIRDLDQIGEQQMMMLGRANPGSSSQVKELIAEGDPAVAPLLEVLESDDRLSRLVSDGRGGSLGRFVHPVREAAFSALVGILKTREFDTSVPYGWMQLDPAARKALVDSMRQFWEKTRSISLPERWYRTLLDDAAGPTRWLEAAGEIVRPDVKEGPAALEAGPHPMNGAPLRFGRDPSVTALMLRRAREIEQSENTAPARGGLTGSCRMGFILADWDDKASLPLLKELGEQCRASFDHGRNQAHPQRADSTLVSFLAKFTEIRVRLGDDKALDEYADWLRTTSPKLMEYANLGFWQPLVSHSDRPSLAMAALWLFTDPKSPWVPLLPEARDTQPHSFESVIASSLLAVAGFREGLLAGLADKTPLGTIALTENGYIERKFKNGSTMKQNASDFDREGIKAGMQHPFRNCDYLALKLSEIEGCPRIDLFWSENRRDEAAAACTAFLKWFGERFTTDPPPGVRDFPNPKGHLAFPILKQPATREDVAAGRAIFSLDGQGETRVASLPGGLPQMARWTTLKDSPYTLIDQNGPRRAYKTDGHVWQVEEVRKGDGWERWYGFVGQHSVSRAPAAEIELEAGVGR